MAADFRVGPKGDVRGTLGPRLLYPRKQTFLRVHEYTPLADDLEGFVAFPAVTINRKVRIEACGLRDAEPFHHCEAGSVDDGKSLIREKLADDRSGIHVGGLRGFDVHAAATNLLPELLRRRAPVPTVQQQPRFDDNVVGRHEVFGTAQDRDGARVIAILGNRRRKPDRRVDKDAQRLPALARPCRLGLRPIFVR